MATVTPSQTGLTAEQFALRPDPGYPEELVKGRIVSIPPPGARHGQVCAEVVWIFQGLIKTHDLGHVLSNDSGVVTRRGPDSVRGADVAYYSYNRVPKGPLSATYPAVPPELVVEVRSPSDQWSKILIKVGEYLDAGVDVVCVLDDDTWTAQVYSAEHPVRVLNEGDDLTFPTLLPDFRVKVGRFFD